MNRQFTETEIQMLLGHIKKNMQKKMILRNHLPSIRLARIKNYNIPTAKVVGNQTVID